MSLSHFTPDVIVPIQPTCYQWLDVDTQTLNQVAAYSLHDPDGVFVTWVVLSGVEPDDLTDPSALEVCHDITRITEMCCRNELTDELQDEITATGKMLLRFKADASVMFTVNGGAITPNLGDPVGEVQNMGPTNPMSVYQNTSGERPTLTTDGVRQRLQFDGSDHLELENVPNTTTPGDAFSVAFVFEPEVGAGENSAFLSSPYASFQDNVTPANTWQSGSWQISRGNSGQGTQDDLVFRYGTGVGIGTDIVLPYPGQWAAFENSGKHLVFILYDGANIRVFIDGVDLLTTPMPEPLALEHVGIFRNRQDNAYPNGFFDELVVWDGNLTPDEIQVINEYAVCFHEISPPAGTVFQETPPGTNTTLSIWEKQHQTGTGTVFVNTVTQDIFVPTISGEVPIPGLGECSGGTCEECDPNELDVSITIATGVGATTPENRWVSFIAMTGPVTVGGGILPTGTVMNMEIVSGFYYNPIIYDATGGQLAIIEAI